MSLPSGLPFKDRMTVLHDAAPLFVTLLDPDDGSRRGPLRHRRNVDGRPSLDAGPTIGGTGRLAARSAAIDRTNLAAD